MENAKNGSTANSINQVLSRWKGSFQGKPLSVMDAAKRLEVPPQTIYDWLAQGKLKPASLTWGENEDKPNGGTGQAFVVPVDPELQNRWLTAGQSSNGSEPTTAVSAKPAVDSVEIKPVAHNSDRVIERIIERPSLNDEEKSQYESQIGFLKGRIEELEKSLSWERDARAKVERDISILSNEKSRLEGQLALSTKVEKSLQRYTDKLEQELKTARDGKS